MPPPPEYFCPPPERQPCFSSPCSSGDRYKYFDPIHRESIFCNNTQSSLWNLNEEIKKKDAIIKLRDEEIKKKDAEIKKKNEEIEIKNNKIILLLESKQECNDDLSVCSSEYEHASICSEESRQKDVFILRVPRT